MAGFEAASINAYRNYPILYDFADKNYKNEQIIVFVYWFGEPTTAFLFSFDFSAVLSSSSLRITAIATTLARCLAAMLD